MTTIAALHHAYILAERRLLTAVRAACPGPHRPVQHRDHMPPWCPACGRTRHGIQIRERETA